MTSTPLKDAMLKTREPTDSPDRLPGRPTLRDDWG